jgi:hypothetical protein
MSDRTTSDLDVDSMVDKWLGDTDNGQEAPDSGTPETPPQAEGTPQPTVEADQTGTPDKPVSEPGKPADNKELPPQQAQKPAPGDLVDREGKVLARAGAERRHYEAAQRATRDLQQTRGELERVTTELRAFREAAQLPTQLGLNPEESTTGLQLMASWKQNPVGVLQYLVEQAKAAGHNLDTLGGPQTDMGAIKKMLAQELAPFRQQAESVQQAQEVQTAAQRQIDALVGEYGEQAMVNAPALGKLIDAANQQGKPLNVEQAYLRFTNWCLQQGFDPHQPIDPQIAERRNQAPQPQQPATQQSNPPRPNGRAVAAPTGVVPIDSAAQVTGNENTRDLVRMAMREAGFNV